MENPWVLHFSEHETPYKGYVSSVEQFEELLQAFSTATGAKFCKSGGKPIDFAATLAMPCRILWENEAVTYSGLPFVNTGWYSYDCHLGVNRQSKQKEDAGRKLKTRPTKKVGCPARIILRKNLIILDEEFQVKQKMKSRGRLNQAAKKLRAVIKKGEGITAEVRLYVKLPESHVHPTCEELVNAETQVIETVDSRSPTSDINLIKKPEDENVIECLICSQSTSSYGKDRGRQEEMHGEEMDPLVAMEIEDSEEDEEREESDEGSVDSSDDSEESFPTISLVDMSETPWVAHFTEYENFYKGYVTSLQQMEELLSSFSDATHSQFVKAGGKVIDFTGNFTRTCNIAWENDLVPYTSYPFINIGWYSYTCQLGGGRQPSAAQVQRRLLEDVDGQRQKRKTQSSRKVGCPAQISLRKVVMIQDEAFKLKERSKGKQNYAAKKVHAALHRTEEPKGQVAREVRMYIKLPLSHSGHSANETVRFKLDPSIESKVQELVKDGFRTPKEVAPLVALYVRDLFEGHEPPPDRRFNPSHKDLYNLIYKFTKPKGKTRKRVKTVESELAAGALCDMREEEVLPEMYLNICQQSEEDEVITQTIEIRASITDFQQFVSQARILSRSEGTTVDHEDTFFNVPEGRLKLRIIKDSSAKLIFYCRTDDNELSVSSGYNSSEISHPEELKETLRLAYGIQETLTKKRWSFAIGSVKLHADLVAGLGTFIKLEVGITANQNIDDGNKMASDLVERLGVKSLKLLSGDYLELLSKKKKNPIIW